ncbi:calcium homeostasis modulator protein 6-like [Empidonax traillii]|uniref:calcium homeostasis modulator protein 6-like n=1 Tax=Empidonax traillii TaxID=164674 RepID=UPI000FFDAA0A|nr:calcium homeostasis modulator protein 6-like [Empidonax traillii]
MQRLRKVLEFYNRHKTVLGYSTVSLLTAASEEIFSSVVFRCPCNSGNMLYGSFFLIVPAFILFLLGYMVNTRIWRLLTGSCPLKKCCDCSLSGTCAQFCQVLVLVTARALVAPLTWIAVALLSSDFYVCAASGNSRLKDLVCKDRGQECQDQLFKIPCDEELSRNIPNVFRSLQAESQLIGWFLIACITAVALISTCISHCCSPVSYLQLKFWKIYSEKEQELFKIKAKEHATNLAEINTNCFFEGTEPVSFQTPKNEDWKNISFFFTLNSQEQYYSMIHKYVNTTRDKSAKSEEGCQSPTGVEVVDKTHSST